MNTTHCRYTLSYESKVAICRFINACEKERRFSRHTVVAYQDDLFALDRYLVRRGRSLTSATPKDISNYVDWRIGRGAHARSVRRYLSSIRSFYAYLLEEGLVDENPAADVKLQTKASRPVLRKPTKKELSALLKAPDTTKPLGHRDRTMLELLCATGIRSSELISLEVSDIDLHKRIVRVVGRDGQEQLIPLSGQAVGWLRNFMQGPRDALLLKESRSTNYLFPTRYGGPLTRQGFWCVVKNCAEKMGIAKENVSVRAIRRIYRDHDTPRQPL